MLIRPLLAALLSLATLTLATGPALAEPADISAAARSVVRVVLIGGEGDGVELLGHGSGVAVGDDLILTNAHVVAQARDDTSVRIGVVPPQGKTGWFAHVVAFSPDNDLALVKIDEQGGLPTAALFTGPVTDGDDVFAVGYPGNVDMAQGLDSGDIVMPTSPVKAHGYVSAGRPSKAFDTILHTAPIAAGNSGGPLLDTCGRVIGVNSFGTISNGTDSPFYFAVSMREITRFLHAAGVKASITGMPCRSIADLDRAEADALAGKTARDAEAKRMADARQAAARETAERNAQLAVIGERENGMALSGLALLLALVAGGAAFAFAQKGDRRRDTRIAAILCVLLLIAAIVAWLSRPSVDEIDERARTATTDASPAPTAGASAAAAGALVCVVDTARSRMTVSPATDVPLRWRADGCVNRRTQYGLASDGWSRILVPNQAETVTIAAYDPVTATYRTDHYLLDLDTMDRLREARGKITPPSCGAGEAAARSFGEAQSALKAMLPASPNERIVFDCRAAR